MRHLKRINESLNTKSIGKEEFMNLLNQNCQKFIDYGTYLEENLIFRKMSNIGDYVYLDPKASTQDRIAPYSLYNFHNLLISNLDSWKGWPRRNKSLICASSYRALSHGGGGDNPANYLVIPFDRTLIASGDRSDFWDCFQNIPYNPDLINGEDSDRTAISYWMTALINDLGYKGDFSKLSTNWSQLKSFLEDTQVSQKVIDKYFNKNYDKNLSVLDNLNILLEPKSNNFLLGDIVDTMNFYSTLDPEESEASESWFEDPCILIKYSEISFSAKSFSVSPAAELLNSLDQN